MFSGTRRHLTVDEAGLLAGQVLARAQAAVRNDPPPVRPRAGAPVVPPLPVTPASEGTETFVHWAECKMIACTVLTCLMILIVQHMG
jgi:hypothetical protein